mmetsp:Transcript_19148/g.16970  ORF Transcript_19148/g.16970 Transcript_19148/m.16970 type:complete len:156 (+) Transcript_19148:428-895(+)
MDWFKNKSPHKAPVKKESIFEKLINNRISSKVLSEKFNFKSKVMKIQRERNIKTKVNKNEHKIFDIIKQKSGAPVLHELEEIENIGKDENADEFKALKSLTKKSMQFMRFLARRTERNQSFSPRRSRRYMKVKDKSSKLTSSRESMNIFENTAIS